ncbi:MAG: hypothetical protein SEPTF4163_002337 [Sporothrix epigloea]
MTADDARGARGQPPNGRQPTTASTSSTSLPAEREGFAQALAELSSTTSASPHAYDDAHLDVFRAMGRGRKRLLGKCRLAEPPPTRPTLAQKGERAADKLERELHAFETKLEELLSSMGITEAELDAMEAAGDVRDAGVGAGEEDDTKA